MYYSGSALDVLYSEPAVSLYFQNDVSSDPYTNTRYCQYTADPRLELDPELYLNSEDFPPDEAGLAAKIGTNEDGWIRGYRYTFLNGDPFDENSTGYQWAFYRFPNSIMLVALYGDLPVQAGDFSPIIYLETTNPVETERYWSAALDGFEGQYFCFDLSGLKPEFLGLWDGNFAGTEPADGCTLDYVSSRDALVALYESTDGDNWTDNANWLVGDPCLNDWHGVGCGRRGVYCDALEEDNWEPGDICYEPSLDIMGLDLANNNLTGTIPPELGKNNFPALLELDLSRNRLSGSIPPELGNLSTLEQFYLDGNLLSGNVPETLCDLTNIIDIPIDGGPLFSLAYNRLLGPDTPLCDQQDPGGTQTVPPTNLVITNAEGSTIDLAWDAIDYTGETGRYRVWYSTSLDGPYLDGGVTADKSTATLTISDLQLNKTYYFIARTETDAHPRNPNNLESENSKAATRITDQVFNNGFESASP